MTAMPSRPRPPAAPALPVEITVAALARACALTPQTMGRRLRDAGVVLRRRGRGTRRRHYFVTYPELQETAPWILEAIEHWNALLARHAPPPRAADDDEEDDA